MTESVKSMIKHLGKVFADVHILTNLNTTNYKYLNWDWVWTALCEFMYVTRGTACVDDFQVTHIF